MYSYTENDSLGGGIFMQALGITLLIVLTAFFLWELRHSLKRSSESVRLISAYIEDLQNPKLIEEIFAFCSSDWKLRRVIQKYDATEEDIRILYKKLLKWGNFRKYNRFVPITSFFYTYSLDYLLQHKEADAKELTMKMMNFLHF